MDQIGYTKQNYANGQVKADLVGGTMTHYFIDGTIKAQGPLTSGKMEGRWIFNKKGIGLWQVGFFEGDVQTGTWTVMNPDGSVQATKRFENGKVVERT